MTTESPALSDATARERIRTELDASLFVNAGAGSGKTTALVSRVLELVLTGHSVDNIAAITFTEAAASELKVRLREKLTEVARQVPGKPSSDAPEGGYSAKQISLANAAVESLDAAAICTLHAFASRLLQQFPTESGLPPAIEVMDPVDSLLAFEADVNSLLDALWEDPELARAMARLDALNIKDAKVSSLFKTLGANWDRLEDAPIPDSPLTPIDVSAVIGELQRALDLKDHCTDESDILFAHLEADTASTIEMLTDLSRSFDADDDIELRSAEHTVLSTYPGKYTGRSGGRKDNWAGKNSEIKDHFVAAKVAMDAEAERVGAEAVNKVAHFAAGQILAAAQLRQRSGKLEFHDLLVLARRLLRDDPDARGLLSDQYPRLLLDEFQDTDPIQIELAMLLAAGRDAAPAESWKAQRVPTGSVFFVGDPNQSIYRFRRADVALYLSAQEAFSAGQCELSTNFRTVPTILEWVNNTFGSILDSTEQAGFTELAPAREPLESSHPPVTLLGGPVEGVRAAQMRQMSAKSITDQIHRMLREQWPTRDGDSVRPLALRDICILVPARTGLPQLERALEVANLPFRVDSSSLLWSTQSIQDLLTILAAIADPRDSLAVVAALRTPTFGCGDDDLARWRNVDSGGPSDASRRVRSWNYVSVDLPDLGEVSDETHERVVRGMARLREWHHDRWWMRPDQMVDRVLNEGRFFELALSHQRPHDHWRRLRFVASAARDFSENRGGDLRAFLAWSRLQTSDVVRVAEPRLSEHDDDAIRIMTIHSSKGLEFPACVLYGLSTKPSGAQRHAQVLWDETGQANVSLSTNVATAGFEAQKAAEEQMGADERDRLLYVAATRAKDWLVVSLTHKAGDKSPGAARLHAAQPKELPAGVAVIEDPDMDVVEASLTAESRTWDSPEQLADAVALARSEAGPQREALQAWRVERDELLAPTAPRVTSATAIAKLAAAAVADGEDSPEHEMSDADSLLSDADPTKVDDQAFSIRRGVSGTAVGSAVHDTLEAVDFTTLADLDGIAGAKAEEYGIGGEVEMVASMARAAAESPLISSLADATLYKELFVAAPFGDRVVEGYVDLLARRPDGSYVLIDYKTDSARSEQELDAAVERYRLQIATYAMLLERSAGIEISEAFLLFVSKGRCTARQVTQLPAAVSEARAVVGA